MNEDKKNRMSEELGRMQYNMMDITTEDTPLEKDLRKGRWFDTTAMQHINIHANCDHATTSAKKLFRTPSLLPRNP